MKLWSDLYQLRLKVPYGDRQQFAPPQLFENCMDTYNRLGTLALLIEPPLAKNYMDYILFIDANTHYKGQILSRPYKYVFITRFLTGQEWKHVTWIHGRIHSCHYQYMPYFAYPVYHASHVTTPPIHALSVCKGRVDASLNSVRATLEVSVWSDFYNRTLRLCSVLPHLGRGVQVLSCSTLAPDRATIPIIPSLSKRLNFSTFFSCSCRDAPCASMLPPKHFFSPNGNVFLRFLGIPLLVTHANDSK
jgi:hypothetical protein